MLRQGLIAGLGLMASAGIGGADAAQPPAWPDTAITRLQALALLQSLNADLLSHDSATLTLDRWCETHHLQSPAKIVAERDRSIDKPATDEQRKILQVSASEPIRYRRVRLACGAHVLSEADNWYVPSRLTAEMNKQLDTSDIAFGRAVQAVRDRGCRRFVEQPQHRQPGEDPAARGQNHESPESAPVPTCDRQAGRGDPEHVDEGMSRRDVQRDVLQLVRVAAPDQRAEHLEQRRDRHAEPYSPAPCGLHTPRGRPQHSEREQSERELRLDTLRGPIGEEQERRIGEQRKVERVRTYRPDEQRGDPRHRG